MRLTDDALAAAREVVLTEAAAASVPEVAFGIISDGQVVAGQGCDRIYRIASMTKSFTAATVLGLCRGLIPAVGRRPDLDDLLADWLPALSTGQWAEEITVRDALTMATGLPKDDPWADRLESMPISQLQRLMQSPALTNFPAGGGFEYANYGYAMLGAFVEAVTGRAFTDVVHLHLIAPLGLESTGFDVRRLDADRLVTGYRRTHDGDLEPQPISLPGAFSAIGGLASTVEDIAVWVAALIESAQRREPGDACRALGRGDAEARAWRRVLADLQQAQRPISIAHARDHAVSVGYGYGLRCAFDTRYGHTAGHSGGYPGFSLHMRWHAATGAGIIVLANLTGFPAEEVATRALHAALAELQATAPDAGLRPASRPATQTPVQKAAAASEAVATAEAEAVSAAATASETATAGRPAVYPVAPIAGFEPTELARTRQQQAEAMIASGDDSGAAAVFSANMDLDIPRSERLAAWARVRDHLDARAPEGQRAEGRGEPVVEWLTALSARWTVWSADGAEPRRGRRVEMMLNPASEIQQLTVTALPEDTAPAGRAESSNA